MFKVLFYKTVTRGVVGATSHGCNIVLVQDCTDLWFVFCQIISRKPLEEKKTTGISTWTN